MSSKDNSSEQPPESEDLYIDMQEVANLQKSPPRPSLWSKVRGAAASYRRRLFVREAVTAEIPGVGEAVAAYETYRFGKEIYDFIKEERRLKRAYEAISRKPPKKPFHVDAEKERAREASKISKITEKKRDQSAAADKLGWDEASSNVKHETTIVSDSSRPSVRELLSKAGSDHHFHSEEQKLLDEASTTARDFEKKYMIGTAQEKYQYIISTAKDKVGKDYFDRVNHPDRVLRLEKFAASRLYTDGHSVAEISSAIKEKSPFIRGIDHKSIDDSVTYDGSIDNHIRYLKEVTNFSHPSLDKEKAALTQWRKEKGISQADRRTPKEFEKAELLQAKVLKEEAEKHMGTQFLKASEMLEKYRANPAMKLTTKEEYQVELARRLDKIPGLVYEASEQDKQMAQVLMLAGHKPGAVAKALQEASFSTEQKYGREMVKEVLLEMRHDPKVSEFRMQLKEFRDKGLIPADETRLDKLGMNFKQTVQHKDLPRDINRVNPHDWIER